MSPAQILASLPTCGNPLCPGGHARRPLWRLTDRTRDLANSVGVASVYGSQGRPRKGGRRGGR